MADGLFATPEELQAQRIAEIQRQRNAMNQMGGSWGGLLSQIASGGGFGSTLAELVGRTGVGGLQNKEDIRAAKVQELMSTLTEVNDPEAYINAAKKLNDMGYTRESLAVMKQRGDVMQQRASELAIQKAERDLANEETRTVTKVTDSWKFDFNTGGMVPEKKSIQVTQVKGKDGKWRDLTFAERRAMETTKTTSDKPEFIVVRDGDATPTGAEPNSNEVAKVYADNWQLLDPAQQEGYKRAYQQYAQQSVMSGANPIPFPEWFVKSLQKGG